LLKSDSVNVEVDHILRECTIATCIGRLDMLSSSPLQRELDPQIVLRIQTDFGEHPMRFMLSNPLIVICSTPDLLSVANFARDECFRVTDPELSFELVDGQHRVQAMRDWCTDRGCPNEHIVWPMRVLHPGIRDLAPAGFLERIMLHSNTALVSKEMNLIDQLRILAEACVRDNDLNGSLTINFVQHCSDDNDVKSSNVDLKRILVWREVAEALVTSQLLRQPMWRDDANSQGKVVVDFLNTLVAFRLPEFVVPIIHAAAEVSQAVEKIIERPCDLSLLVDSCELFKRTGCIEPEEKVKWIIDRPTVSLIREAVKDICMKHSVPSLLYHPRVDVVYATACKRKSKGYKFERAVLSKWLEFGKDVVKLAMAISLDIQTANQSFAKPRGENLNIPVLPLTTPFGRLAQAANPTNVDEWKKSVQACLSPIKLGRLIPPMSELLESLEDQTGKKHDRRLNEIVGHPESVEAFCSLVVVLLETHQCWWELIATIGIVRPGQPIGCTAGAANPS
ncbi:hypothetical protein BDN70DRAFT_902330, partial [Pholiota conissans]